MPKKLVLRQRVNIKIIFVLLLLPILLIFLIYFYRTFNKITSTDKGMAKNIKPNLILDGWSVHTNMYQNIAFSYPKNWESNFNSDLCPSCDIDYSVSNVSADELNRYYRRNSGGEGNYIDFKKINKFVIQVKISTRSLKGESPDRVRSSLLKNWSNNEHGYYWINPSKYTISGLNTLQFNYRNKFLDEYPNVIYLFAITENKEIAVEIKYSNPQGDFLDATHEDAVEKILQSLNFSTN